MERTKAELEKAKELIKKLQEGEPDAAEEAESEDEEAEGEAEDSEDGTKRRRRRRKGE